MTKGEKRERKKNDVEKPAKLSRLRRIRVVDLEVVEADPCEKSWRGTVTIPDIALNRVRPESEKISV